MQPISRKCVSLYVTFPPDVFAYYFLGKTIAFFGIKIATTIDLQRDTCEFNLVEIFQNKISLYSQELILHVKH